MTRRAVTAPALRRAALALRCTVAVALVFILAGCALFTPPPSMPTPTPPPATVIFGDNNQLARGKRVYIALPPVTEAQRAGAAVFGLVPPPAQGRAALPDPEAPSAGIPVAGRGLADALGEALKPFVASSVTAGTIARKTPSLTAARAAKARYLFMPSLDAAWFETYEQVPNAGLGFFLSVFDVPTGRHLLMRHIDVRTGSSPLGGARELLRTKLDETARTLFEAADAPAVPGVPSSAVSRGRSENAPEGKATRGPRKSRK